MAGIWEILEIIKIIIGLLWTSTDLRLINTLCISYGHIHGQVSVYDWYWIGSFDGSWEQISSVLCKEISSAPSGSINVNRSVIGMLFTYCSRHLHNIKWVLNVTSSLGIRRSIWTVLRSVNSIEFCFKLNRSSIRFGPKLMGSLFWNLINFCLTFSGSLSSCVSL